MEAKVKKAGRFLKPASFGEDGVSGELSDAKSENFA